MDEQVKVEPWELTAVRLHKMRCESTRFTWAEGTFDGKHIHYLRCEKCGERITEPSPAPKRR